MLAMGVNDNAGHLIPRGVWTTIASKLAPTKSESTAQIRRKMIACLAFPPFDEPCDEKDRTRLQPRHPRHGRAPAPRLRSDCPRSQAR
ncbi:hypothetical protein GC387_18520 [Pseudomonas sp. MWU12-2323]|nr:hypothetical protein [Pseudomonas sp. MWU12-2323]